MNKLIKLIPTDIEQIDALIKGFYPSELIVIGAKPGCGKTTFLCELAKNICVDKTGLFFSLQTEKKLLTAKLFSCISKVPLLEVLDKSFKENDSEEKYNSLKLTIFDDSNIETDKLISKQGFQSDEVVIEDDCWIATNVTILKGVHVGRHSVIGTGVILYKDVPANSVIVCKQELRKVNKKYDI